MFYLYAQPKPGSLLSPGVFQRLKNQRHVLYFAAGVSALVSPVLMPAVAQLSTPTMATVQDHGEVLLTRGDTQVTVSLVLSDGGDLYFCAMDVLTNCARIKEFDPNNPEPQMIKGQLFIF